MYFHLKSVSLSLVRHLIFLIPLLVLSDHLAAKEHKLLVLGDSLSAAYGLKQDQGWVTLLQNAWKDQGIIVINGAISGETTDGGLARLPRLLEQHQPNFLLIELGGNDGLQGHPVSKMKNNISKMIKLGKLSGAQVILQEIQIPTNYGRRYNQLFTGSYKELADQYQIPLIPFFLQDIALKPELMQNDGIHPNLAAQPLISEFMQENLEPLILQ